MLPYLTGKRNGRPHETLFWRQNRRTAIRLGDWKLLRNPRGPKGADWELYDLNADVGESHDLADKKPRKVAQLKAAWAKLNAEMVEPSWRPGSLK